MSDNFFWWATLLIKIGLTWLGFVLLIVAIVVSWVFWTTIKAKYQRWMLRRALK